MVNGVLKMVDESAERPVIRHRFGPGLWKPAYSLTWDWNNCRWIETLEPERGEALTWKDIGEKV